MNLCKKRSCKFCFMLSKIEGIEDLSMTSNGVLLSKYAKYLKNAGLHRINISLDTINPDKFRELNGAENLRKSFPEFGAKNAGLYPIKINCVIKNSIEEPDALAVKKYCDEQGLLARFIYEMDIEKGEFGVVHEAAAGDCANCTRLRLTSDGYLKPCLFNDIAVNIRKTDYKEALKFAIEHKPECGMNSTTHKFYNIGG